MLCTISNQYSIFSSFNDFVFDIMIILSHRIRWKVSLPPSLLEESVVEKHVNFFFKFFVDFILKSIISSRFQVF